MEKMNEDEHGWCAYDIEQWNLLQLFYVGQRGAWRKEMVGRNLANAQGKAIQKYYNESPLCN
jgi:hypothetical protein